MSNDEMERAYRADQELQRLLEDGRRSLEALLAHSHASRLDERTRRELVSTALMLRLRSEQIVKRWD